MGEDVGDRRSHVRLSRRRVARDESRAINTLGAPATAETAITIVAGAIGNAIFDATGARIREAPFTPERVKAALAMRT